MSTVQEQAPKRISQYQLRREQIQKQYDDLVSDAVNSKQWRMLSGLILLLTISHVTFLFNPIVGLYVTVLSFVLLANLALFSEAYRRVTIAITILPVATIVTAALPQSNRYALIAINYLAILLLSLGFWFMLRKNGFYRQTRMTSSHAVPLKYIILLGILLGVFGFAVLLSQPLGITSLNPVIVILGCIGFAFTEEFLFRGLIQRQVTQISSANTAIIITTLLFTLFAASQSNPLNILVAGVSSLVLSVIYSLKSNIFTTFAINAMMKLTFVSLIALFAARS
ncbi:hypothetical protein CYG49_02515 [Candidatus Saccharibacteria bacterium]|nr:MAG: hypothetical protein CYG49_02515 [Candidatus Saccharibacteria bacterium]